MFQRRVFFVSIFMILLALASNVYAANVLMQIGRSPFHKPPLTSPADLIAMVQSKQAEVKKGFTLAGNAELYAPFVEQLVSVCNEITSFYYLSWRNEKERGVTTVDGHADPLQKRR